MTNLPIYNWGITELPSQQELDRMLDKTKSRLFLGKRAAFLGTLMCSLEFKWDSTVETAYTNGLMIGWNPYFYMSLPEPERQFVMVHEIWHVAYQHVSRFKLMGSKANHDKYNIAADHVINLDCIANGYSTKNLGLQIYADPKYKGWSTEEVYNDLPDYPPSPDGGGGKPSPNGSGLSGDLRDGGQEADSKVVSAIVKAVQSAQMAKEAGDIPGEITTMIDEFLNPKLPWEVMLQNFFNEISNQDFSYKRPNRRYEEVIMPSMIGTDALEHLAWYMDVSGSVNDEQARRMASEIKFIKEEFNPKRLTICLFDTKIQETFEFDEDDEFKGIKIVGRGGTSLEPVRRHILDMKPTAAVVFSDMYCSPMQSDPGIPIIWIVVDNNHAKTPFGTQYHVED